MLSIESAPAPTTRKRGLTVSAPTADDAKKPKIDSTPPPIPVPVQNLPKDASSKPADNPNPPATDAGRDGSPPPARLQGDGPHTLFTFSEAISEWHGGDGGHYLVLKEPLLAVLDATSEALGKEEKEEAEEALMDDVTFFAVDLPEGASETNGASALQDAFAALPGHPWWFEVTVQRAKPEKGVPAMEIQLDENEDEQWWITGYAEPDERAAKAAEIIERHIPLHFMM